MTFKVYGKIAVGLFSLIPVFYYFMPAKPGGAVTINKVFINPDPPQIGKDVNVIVSYNLSTLILT